MELYKIKRNAEHESVILRKGAKHFCPKCLKLMGKEDPITYRCLEHGYFAVKDSYYEFCYGRNTLTEKIQEKLLAIYNEKYPNLFSKRVMAAVARYEARKKEREGRLPFFLWNAYDGCPLCAEEGKVVSITFPKAPYSYKCPNHGTFAVIRTLTPAHVGITGDQRGPLWKDIKTWYSELHQGQDICFCACADITGYFPQALTTTKVIYSPFRETLSLFSGWKKFENNRNTDRLMVQQCFSRVTINLRTHQAYLVPIGVCNGGRFMGRAASLPRIMNISGGSWYFNPWHNFQMEDVEAFYKEYLKFRPDRTGLSQEMKAEDSVTADAILRRIAFGERYPNLLYSYDEYSKMKALKDYPAAGVSVFGRNFHKKIPPVLMDSGEFVKYMVRELKVPAGKKLKKMYMEDHMVMARVYFFKTVCGVGAEDNLRKLVEYSENEKIGSYNFANREVRQYFRKLRKCCPNETVFTNRVTAIKGFYLHKDTAAAYATLLSCGEEEFVRLAENSFTGDIRQTHDNLSRIRRRLVTRNREIPYSKEEKGFPAVLGEVEFSLPKDTHELVSIGEELDICVGGYGDSAVEKYCTIMAAVTGGKYVACFELRKSDGKWRVVQAKGSRNSRIPDGLMSVTRKWAEQNRFLTDCYDMEDIC